MSSAFGALLVMAQLVVLRIDALAFQRQYRSVKVREVLQRLQQEGWVLRRQRASHRQFYHPSFPERRLTVAAWRFQESGEDRTGIKG
jgi:predicted RNA binding protein YcfA (HicA-like mRNA interferase family)